LAGRRILNLVSAELISLVCALTASVTALAIAIQNRRWLIRDRQADYARRDQQLQLQARLSTRRRAGEALVEFDSSNCPMISRVPGAAVPDVVEDIKAVIRAVEPYRRWAATLPLVWRIRIDGQLSQLAHFGSATAAWQLQRDVADLLNGEPNPSPIEEHTARSFEVYLSVPFCTPRDKEDSQVAPLRTSVLLTILELPDTERFAERGRQLLDAVTGRAPLALAA
jgi:hypothetical protein